MPNFHLAQINIARMKTVFDDPAMAGFIARLAEINALADTSPGFVWRLQTSEGNATDLRPYDDDRIIVNMSVWETVSHLQQYVYQSQHRELLRQRAAWFEKFDGVYTTLWWIPAGHLPNVEEAKARLALLEKHGPTASAFTFQNHFRQWKHLYKLEVAMYGGPCDCS